MKPKYNRGFIPMKTRISEYIKATEKHGAMVFTFNSHKRMPTGSVGFVDHLILYKGLTVFAEVKVGKDKFSPKQIMTAIQLCNNCKKSIDQFYVILEEGSYQDVICSLLQKSIFELSKWQEASIQLILMLEQKLILKGNQNDQRK